MSGDRMVGMLVQGSSRRAWLTAEERVTSKFALLIHSLVIDDTDGLRLHRKLRRHARLLTGLLDHIRRR